MVEISAPVVTDGAPGVRRFTADVGGHAVWFEMPTDLAPAPRGEMFLAVALFMAIARGEDLTIDSALPLCPELKARLPKVLKILRQWNPEFHLPRIEAHTEPVPSRPGMVISSFSGGVDSTYTYARHRGRISHIMVTNCFDVAGDKDPFEALVAKIEAFAADHGTAVLPVATNAREVSEAEGMIWDYLHGPFLCTLATAFGPETFFIPSSYTARELKPWGSHPLLDPLWATTTTGIVYDGIEATRTDKTLALVAESVFLRHLQVCWYSKVKNCGTCSKCTRTLLVLQELGAEGAPFPPGIDALDHIDNIKPKSDAAAGFIWDLWQFFKERGRGDIAARFRKRLDRYLLKRSFNNLVKTLIGRRGQDFIHRVRGTNWREWRVIIRDPDNFE